MDFAQKKIKKFRMVFGMYKNLITYDLSLS